MGESDFSVTGDGDPIVFRAPDALARDAWVQAVAKAIISLRDQLKPSTQGRRQ
jgi:hypothetical protein